MSQDGGGAPRRLNLSPLRYPGGKAKLYQPFKTLIATNRLRRATYVEPYAGGAGAAINLLLTGVVDQLVLNDLDPTVYAFWRAAVEHNDELRDRVSEIPVTIEEWRRQKEVFMSGDASPVVDLGLATFFLNRTNRSGVLNAGPIGGQSQSGNYKIGARFNRKELLRRLELIGRYAQKIKVLNLDGEEVVRRYAGQANTFIYVDPPYFNKAGTLYMNSFSADQHASLAECLNSKADARWVLTYDDVPQIEELYVARRRQRLKLRYSAYRVVEAEEILISSDGLELPDILSA